MRKLESYAAGHWQVGEGEGALLVNPSTEEPLAAATTTGLDFGGILEWARLEGGPALREMSFEERAGMLKALSHAIRERREDLLELSRDNNGTTQPDGAFDIDGASASLGYYASLGRRLGTAGWLAEGDGEQLGRTDGFWGQHVLLPRRGVAVHIGAFNFPAWGMAEKAACALLAGMPVITKPATATALVAEACARIMLEADVLPRGAFQFVCGSTGDLLDRLGPQDVLAFTGSAETARTLRNVTGLTNANSRFNVEADSLNAAVVAPDVEAGSATFDLAIRDVAREMTQKAGQKCTAVRRILVPPDLMDDVAEALSTRLGRVAVGNPADESVRMGPLATAAQLESAVAGAAALAAEADLVLGSGERQDGIGSPPGRGFFLAPTLLRVERARDASTVHEREVFGPVATMLAYDGSARDAGEIVAMGGGTLVTSVYGDDAGWLAKLVAECGATTGRVYVGSSGSAEAAYGSGVAMPQSLHGGPGRAGDGQELGGLIGVKLYMQRVALQGDRGLVDAVAGAGSPEEEGS